jgi:hypothetical protein
VIFNATATFRGTGETYNQTTGRLEQGTSIELLQDVRCFVATRKGTRVKYQDGLREVSKPVLGLSFTTYASPSLPVGCEVDVRMDGSNEILTYTVNDPVFVPDLRGGRWACDIERLKTADED